MNYRHAYHAGNFADVLKHCMLARILVHLREKAAPFRVIDTHAGEGEYDLTGPEAEKSGEWREGIGRVFGAKMADPAQALVAPYLDAVAALNPDGNLRRYPGSPAIVRSLMRSADRLTACEREPAAAQTLRETLRRDRRIKVVAIDGWTALRAAVPPRERRGLVLIDPPFEERGEFDRLATRLAEAHRKWPTGVYLAWYPVKQIDEARAFARALVKSAIPKVLRIEMQVAPRAQERLAAAGLVVVNPPWRLFEETNTMLPEIGRLLGAPSPGAYGADWLTGEA